MDDITFSQLTSCDPSLAWSIIKDLVQEDFLGPDVIMIPFLTEAQSYDLLHVVVKENKGTFNRLLRKPYSYRVIGHLDELVFKRHTNAKMLEHCRQPIKEEQKFNPNYVFSIERTQNGQRKLIELKLNDCTKSIAPLTMNQGDLVLDLSSPGESKLVRILVYLFISLLFECCVFLSITIINTY